MRPMRCWRQPALTLTLAFGSMSGACSGGRSVDKLMDPHAGSSGSSSSAGDATAASGTGAPFTCGREKTPTEFMTTLSEDLFRRGPGQTELQMADAAGFDPAAAVDWALTQPDFQNTGIAYFVSNLLRINENLHPTNPKDPDDVALTADLAQEAVVLVQRNLDKPWSYVLTTRDIYCTARTGALYGYPVDPSVAGFVECQMEPQRAGMLGLVSVLRAYSSAFYLQNNNYHRNALAVYLAQGLELIAKTNGPVGSGTPPPLPACVPELDNRVSPAGLVFGTAAVPHSGTTCAGCHIPFHAEMVAGFLQFGPSGELLQLADIDKLQPSDTLGIGTGVLTDILTNSGTSCWSSTGPADPPQVYQGLPGLARLITTSPKLALALGIQIQQNWMNTSPVDAATQAVEDAYNANGGTLTAALKGYLLSAPYLCSEAVNP